ncbi:hypothetical protein [Paenirhodobacter populi]|uniref:DUF4412 domain-containing protein n=1 Tax=Paenirhodobacter populi TaxID=2306993 RepID=A0A443IJC4_9RHOB|nr:hypothetical protein [Sinirhodobacter populi]RWR04393.1 hypothetical protein D2T33_21150 [Sinirhodobacter populi]
MLKKSFALSACVALFPALALADELKEVEYTGKPAYSPVAVLGITPGMTLDEAKALMEARGMEMSTEKVSMRASTTSGKTFDLSAVAKFDTAGVGLNTRMSGGGAYDEIGGTVDLGVLGGRIISVGRAIRGDNADLPKPDELRAQLTQEYGEPSLVEIDAGGKMTITYGWDEAGMKLSDLDQFEPIMVEREKTASIERREYVPCLSAGFGTMRVEYKTLNSETAIAPGCAARYTVVYESKPGQSTIRFSLTDYDRARKAREETDRQINEALTGTAKASNMDL